MVAAAAAKDGQEVTYTSPKVDEVDSDIPGAAR